MITKFKKPISSLLSQVPKCLASSVPQGPSGSNVVKFESGQFSKKRLTDFGELPTGQIPDALQYDHPHEITSLSNGVRVASESWLSPLATISLTVKAGTRNETLETSGVSQFIKNLSLRGTSSRTREQVEKELGNLGGNYTVEVSRETTSFTLTVLPEHASKAVELLSDIVLNPLLNANQIEAEKPEIYKNAAENHRDQMDVTLESAHFTSYRDHFIGQPILGIRENLPNITQNNIKQFHADNYVASNIVLVGAGNVKHQELGEAAAKFLGNLPKTPANQKNSEKPYFTPSTLYMRDDEMTNINSGVFFNAPTWKDPEFFSMKIIQHLMGEYRADKYTGAHLNASHRQHNTYHSFLGDCPDITLHKCIYFPYADTAIFGNYLHGNEVFGSQILYSSQVFMTEFASYINQAEFFRARNAYYNELLTRDNSIDIAKKFANQLIYLGRRVPRSEVAKRVAHMDVPYINNVVSKWFWDTDISLVAWGPLHNVINFSHYNRPIKRSSLGWYGNTHTFVM